MARMHVPTARELEEKLKLLEIEVEGQYIAMIDEKRRTSRNYKIKVLVPEGYTKSEIKRLTPKVLQKEKDDFMSLRTFAQVEGSKAVKTDKTMKRKELFSSVELSRFERLRAEELREQQLRQQGGQFRGGVRDDSEYDPDTGLPPVING